MSKRGKILKALKTDSEAIMGLLKEIMGNYQKAAKLGEEDAKWIFKRLEAHIEKLEAAFDEAGNADMEFRQTLSNYDVKPKKPADDDDDLPF